MRVPGRGTAAARLTALDVCFRVTVAVQANRSENSRLAGISGILLAVCVSDPFGTGCAGWACGAGGRSKEGQEPRQASPLLLSAFPVLQPTDWPHWSPSSVSWCRPVPCPVPCPMAPSVPEQPGRGPRRTEGAVPLALGSADAARGQLGGSAVFSRFLLQKESLQGVRGRLLAAKVLTNSR